MKLTSLSMFVLSASLVLATTPFVDHTDEVGYEKLYVNPHGEVIIPQEFPWGHYVMKEKDAARNRTTCMGRTDPSGRLGKRQAYCPSGYTLACDAYAASPCCPNETPVCCSGGTVCCAAGQFCQGTTTCCNAGQIGCGEGCCNFGETCCGSKCCGGGTTCDNGECKPPYDGYVTPTPSTTSRTSSTSVTSSTSSSSNTPPSYGPGPSRTVTPSYSNPYGSSVTISIPSYTIPNYGGFTPTPSCNDNNHQVVVVGAAVGACLGAFALIMAALAAWLWRKNRACEAELAGYRPTPTQPPAEEPKPTYNEPTPAPPKPEEPSYGNNGTQPTQPGYGNTDTQPTQPGYGSTPAPPPANNY